MLTRSSSKDARSKSLSGPTSRSKPSGANAKSSGMSRRVLCGDSSRAQAIEARRAKSTRANSSDSPNTRVATSSASSRSRTATSSSPVIARRPRAPPHVERTLASTRSRRGTDIPALEVPQPSPKVPFIFSAPPSPAQPVRKRKVDSVEVVVPRPKRQRTTNSNAFRKTDPPSLAERLKADKEALHRREFDLKEREIALEKKEKNLTKRDKRSTDKLKRLQAGMAKAEMKLTKLGDEVKELSKTNATLEKKIHERIAEVSALSVSPGRGVGTQWVLALLEDQFQCSLYVLLISSLHLTTQ